MEILKYIFFTADACYGTVVATGGLNIRQSPDTSSPVVEALPEGSYVTIFSRVDGTPVNGNTHWFNVGNGFAAAYYINVSAGSTQPWCSSV